MGKTSIEWTDASWNPIVGCTEISPGCANCYAARLAGTRLKNHPDYNGLADKRRGQHGWTGGVRLLLERLQEPLHWRKPRRIFVCDMGDLFHESVDVEAIDLVFQTIARAPWHTFQILTKRAGRMQAYMLNRQPMADRLLKHVWLGVSVENQHFADERIPLLLETPAAVHWISAEPLLGKVYFPCRECEETTGARIDWVVCGGESGANARPMHPDWARSMRDQCKGAGVAFFFKQWGEWLHIGQLEHVFTNSELDSMSMHTKCRDTGCGDLYFKVGKRRAGRLLDGLGWNEFPQPHRWVGRFA